MHGIGIQVHKVNQELRAVVAMYKSSYHEIARYEDMQ